jgi:hypothetical protein
MAFAVPMALLARRRAMSAPADTDELSSDEHSTGELSSNTQATSALSGGPPPADAIKQAKNVVRDSRLAIAVVLLPIIAPMLGVRLAEWHALRKQYPILVSRDAGELSALARQFRRARGRLWFGIVLSIVTLLAYTFLLSGPK